MKMHRHTEPKLLKTQKYALQTQMDAEYASGLIHRLVDLVNGQRTHTSALHTDAESYLAWLIRQCATPSGPQIRAPRRGECQLTITTPNTRVSLANENDGDGPPARSNVSPHAAPGFAPWALP